MKRRFTAALWVVAVVVTSTAPAADYPPPSGTDRESEEYLEAAETFLSNLDLDDADLVFRRLGGTTATNWSVEVDGEPVADLKCTSGNTNHHGAVVAYRLGRELGFPIYPVAVYRDVTRRIDGRMVDQQCALKEWSSVFTQYYWTRDTFSSTDDPDKRRLVDALRCEGRRPGPEDGFRFHARSAYGHPSVPGVDRVRYEGHTSLLEAARDFSTMMVIDTLIGNEDRFPGGNTFFRSVTTSHASDGGGIVFVNVRLFSLDNEAAFKGRTPSSTHSARDLATYVSRFDPAMISALERLAGDARALARITDGNEELAGFIREGIRIVIDRHASSLERCGEQMASY